MGLRMQSDSSVSRRNLLQGQPHTDPSLRLRVIHKGHQSGIPPRAGPRTRFEWQIRHPRTIHCLCPARRGPAAATARDLAPALPLDLALDLAVAPAHTRLPDPPLAVGQAQSAPLFFLPGPSTRLPMALQRLFRGSLPQRPQRPRSPRRLTTLSSLRAGLPTRTKRSTPAHSPMSK
jgi:hypothetical protein